MVGMVADMMYVAYLKFLVSSSLGINLITSEYVMGRLKTSLKAASEQTIRLYHNCGKQVTTAMVDGEFDPLWGIMGSTDVIVVTAPEHVPETECIIWVIKEWFLALKYTLLFKTMQSYVIIEAISFCVMWLNAFTSKVEFLKYMHHVLLWQIKY